MNAAECFRLRLQALVARGLAATTIAERVGLAAASEVWGGDAPRDRPAWYVWLRGARGAWQIELAEAGALEAAGGAAILGRFTVRRYPSPDDPVLARFSQEERRVAAACLDATGTPRIELAATVPDALFTVGSVEWALDLAGGAAVLGLATLDALRTVTDRGEVLRDVPGWELTAPIFSLLAGLHAQVERRAATRLLVTRQRGFELVLRGDVREDRDAAGAVQGAALLAFPGVGQGETAASLLELLRDAEAERIADVSLARGAHAFRAAGAEPRLALTVSPAWFGGAAHLHDRAMCAC